MKTIKNGDPKKEDRFNVHPAFMASIFPDSPPPNIPEGYVWNGRSLVPEDWEEVHGRDGLDLKRLLRGVSRVESADGRLMFNPTSTATGLYGQLYSEIKDLPIMKGVSREEFGRDRDLQNKIFNMRIEEGLSGNPSLRRNAEELTEEYAPQLGDKWDFSLDEVAALSNYLGRKGTREYFASLRDNKEYHPVGLNKPVSQYLEIYRREK